MNEAEFRAYLKRNRRKASAIDQIVSFVLTFEEYLQNHYPDKKIEQTSVESLESYVSWIESEPDESASKALWAIRYYFDFIGNRALSELSGDLRSERIKRKPFYIRNFRGVNSDEIAKLVSDLHIDLTVTATHGRSGLKRLVLGSVTERLMRILPCPLLVVKSLESDDTTIERLELRIKKILVGCDFSPYSELAFQYGLSLAQEFEAEVHLVHVIETPAYKGMMKLAVNQGEEFKNEYMPALRKSLPI